MNQDLVERVARLETQNRRLKRAGVVVATILATVLLLGQTGPEKPVKALEAETIRLVDGNGKAVAWLGWGPPAMTEAGVFRSYYFDIGRALVDGQFHMSNTEHHGMVLWLFDKKGKKRFYVERDPKGDRDDVRLALSDTDGNERIKLSVEKTESGDTASILIKDEKGKVIWKAP